MKAFRRANLIWLILPLLALFVMGCGVADDYEGAATLNVISHSDGNDPGNGIVNIPYDGGEWGDAFNAILVFSNTPRLGVEPGVDLRMKNIVVSYRDANGNRRDTQGFEVMPRWDVPGVGGTIEPNGTLELNLPIVPVPYYLVDGNGSIFDIFRLMPSADRLYASPEQEFAAAQWWTAYIQAEAVEVDGNGDEGDRVTTSYTLDIFFHF